MRSYIKTVFTICIYFFISSSYATVHDIKTVGATFSPDTTYAQLGDTIKFIISIGHDAREITNDSYNTNIMSPLPGGFNFSDGTFEYELAETKTFYFACSFHLASSQMKGVIIVSNPAGIVEVKNFDYGVNMYPNPTTDVLFVTLSGPDQISAIQIFDISGKLVFTSNNINSGVSEIDMRHLKSGAYFIIVQYDDRTKKLNLVKM